MLNKWINKKNKQKRNDITFYLWIIKPVLKLCEITKCYYKRLLQNEITKGCLIFFPFNPLSL